MRGACQKLTNMSPILSCSVWLPMLLRGAMASCACNRGRQDTLVGA